MGHGLVWFWSKAGKSRKDVQEVRNITSYCHYLTSRMDVRNKGICEAPGISLGSGLRD